MSTCTVTPSSHEKVRNGIKNMQLKIALDAIDDENIGLSKYEKSKRKLAAVQERSKLKDEKYVLNDITANSRVTTELKKRSKFKANLDALNKEQQTILKREFGTAGHKAMEDIGNLFIKRFNEALLPTLEQGYSYKTIEDMTAVMSSEIRNLYVQWTKENPGWGFTEQQFVQLAKGLKKVYLDIYKTQADIDNTKLPSITTEQRLISAIRDVGGTMDIHILYSNNTAQIFDFKFMTTKSSSVRKDKNGKLIKIDEGWIYGSKKEDFKLQLGTYELIAKQEYGISSYLSKRIIPIWFELEAEKDINGKLVKDENDKVKLTKKVSGIAMQFGIEEETDELYQEVLNKALRQVSTSKERTGVAQLDRALESKYKEVERLRLKAKRSKDPDIWKRIKDIEEEIYNFVLNKDILFAVENTLFRYQTLMSNKKSLSDEEIIDGIRDLEVSIEFLNTVFLTADETVSEQLYDAVTAILFENDLLEKVRVLSSNVQRLKNEILQKELMWMHDNVAFFDSDEILRKESGFFDRNFKLMSKYNNPYIKALKINVDKSLQRTREEVQAVEKDIQRLYDNLRNAGLTQEFRDNLIINKGTGRLHSKLSEKFYQDRTNAIEEGDTKFFSNYYEHSKLNKKGETYEEWLNRAREEYVQSIEIKYAEDQAKEYYIQRDLDSWDSRYNLYKDGRVNIKAWSLNAAGFLKLKDNAFTDYPSQAYTEIKKYPAVLEYYEWWNDKMNELRNELGMQYRNLPNNFIPYIRKDMIDMLQSNGILKGLKIVTSDLFDIMPDDTQFGMTDEYGNMKNIPVFFTNRNAVVNDKGEFDANLMSFDLDKNILLFSRMAYNYSNMSKIESTVHVLQNLMQKSRYASEDKWGRVLEGDTEGMTAEESGMMKTFNDYVDTYMYGIKSDGSIPPVAEKVLQSVKNFETLSTLGFNFAGGIASGLSAQVALLFERNKGISITKASYKNAWKKMTTDFQGYHALSHFFGTSNNDYISEMNITTTKLNGLNRTVVSLGDGLYRDSLRKYLSSRVLMSSFRIQEERIDDLIANSMADNFGYDDKGNLYNLSRFGENVPSYITKISDGFTFDEKGQIFLKNITNEDAIRNVIIKFRNAYRDTQQKIKGTMSDEDIRLGQRNIIFNLFMQYKTWMPGVFSERFKGFISKTEHLAYNDAIDSFEMGRYRAAYNIFNKYGEDVAMPAFLLRQTGALALNIAKGLIPFTNLYKVNREYAEREYRHWAAKQKPEVLERLGKNHDERLTEYIRIKQGQINAAMGELQAMIILSSIVMLLALGLKTSDDDDNEEQVKFVLHKAYQILNRMNTEISATLNPNELMSLVRGGGIPLSNTLLNVYKLIGNTFDETRDLFTEEDMKGFIWWKEDKKDTKPPAYYLLREAPVLNFIKWLDIFEQDQKSAR